MIDINNEKLMNTRKLNKTKWRNLKDLQYNDYKKYEVEPSSIGFYNWGHKFIFPNGYGASVIRHKR